MMLRRVIFIGVAMLSILAAAVVGGLAWAHLVIRAEQVPLPNPESLALPLQADGPISLSYINTASQPMTRGAVLEAAMDPTPDAPYIMSHPAFVLRWEDGRILLIDAGMSAEEAINFGSRLEWFTDAQPIQPHQTVAEALGERVHDIGGIIFTHLHTDHVNGLIPLCAKRRDPLPIFMTTLQYQVSNYTTQPGRIMIEEAGCARVEELVDGPLMNVPRFPGVAIFTAGGHTPGSQVILAAVGRPGNGRVYAFLGDIVNNIDGVNHNLSKPYVYSTLVVPEDDLRLGTLRVMLQRFRDRHGAVLLPAHDQIALEATGVPAYTPDS